MGGGEKEHLLLILSSSTVSENSASSKGKDLSPSVPPLHQGGKRSQISHVQPPPRSRPKESVNDSGIASPGASGGMFAVSPTLPGV